MAEESADREPVVHFESSQTTSNFGGYTVCVFTERTYSSTQYSTGYNTVKYLPSGSTYYQIKDAYTEDVIVPFGSGSKVSCDSTGNYFNFWMNGLQSERFYRINYKVVSGSGTVDETIQYFDEKHSFKVVR